jgi:NADH:ubiquinone oxidoreductase subunit H
VPLILVASAASIAFFRMRIDLATPTGFAVLLSLAIVQLVNVEYELESNEHQTN